MTIRAKQAIGPLPLKATVTHEAIGIEPKEHTIRLSEIGVRQSSHIQSLRQPVQFARFQWRDGQFCHAMLILIASAASVMSSTGTVSVTPTRK